MIIDLSVAQGPDGQAGKTPRLSKVTVNKSMQVQWLSLGSTFLLTFLLISYPKVNPHGETALLAVVRFIGKKRFLNKMV